MYPQYGRDSSFIVINDVLVGVAMGSDNTTEHESGIAPLQSMFGLVSAAPNVHARFSRKSVSDYERWLSEKNAKTVKAFFRRLFRKNPPLPSMGLDKRRIKKVPTNLRWVDKDGVSGFVCLNRDGSGTLNLVDKFLGYFVRDRTLVCGWSDESFVALAKGHKDIERLATIFTAMLSGDACIGSFGLPGRGLSLVIASRVPEETRDELLEDDLEEFTLARRVGETGIVDEVRASGKSFFSLSKGMVDEDDELRIWLNPCEQHLYNYGWYTVEELRQWTKNEGPIMKKASAA